jgi:hypothetical protein
MGDTISEARRITDRAASALWTFYSRPKPDGTKWRDIEGFKSQADYRASLADRPGKLGEECRMALDAPGVSTEETEAFRRFLALDAATELAHR